MTFVGIVGARKFKDRKSVIEFVNELPADSTVVTGSCRGVCTWAGSAAKLRGLQVKIYSPNLNNAQGKYEIVQRYYQRNRQLISSCDVVHAFISKEAGFTGGTKFEVEYSTSLGKMVFLHWENSIVERVYQQSLPFGNHAKELSSVWMNFFFSTLS